MHEESEKISYKICAFYAQESWFQIVDSHMIGKFVFKSASKSRDTSRKISMKNSDLRKRQNTWKSSGNFPQNLWLWCKIKLVLNCKFTHEREIFHFSWKKKSRDLARKIAIENSDPCLSKNDKMHEIGEEISYEICYFDFQESRFWYDKSHVD